ncbi:MAG TPA: hypothetical protein VG452_01775 [Egibacteraceae bacterium]|nr:hypothetical protein [Actinomycetota bacterium]HWB70918.1 hypothetical protein [Egibacteraceae bacterium]
MVLTIDETLNGWQPSDLRREVDELQHRIDALRRGGISCRLVDEVQRSLDAVCCELGAWVDGCAARSAAS